MSALAWTQSTVRHLLRLPGRAERVGPLFPGRSNPLSHDPERSRPARRRNALVKQLLAGVGLDFEKPWQACRATCNERLESCRQGSGQFVLGHCLTLNSRSYRQPDQLIYEAVNTVPQPACFQDF
jgi:hypothetical protein